MTREEIARLASLAEAQASLVDWERRLLAPQEGIFNHVLFDEISACDQRDDHRHEFPGKLILPRDVVEAMLKAAQSHVTRSLHGLGVWRAGLDEAPAAGFAEVPEPPPAAG